MFPVYRRIYGAGFPLTVSFLACYAVTLTVVISLAAITYRWIEKPGMRAGKRLIDRLAAGIARPSRRRKRHARRRTGTRPRPRDP